MYTAKEVYIAGIQDALNYADELELVQETRHKEVSKRSINDLEEEYALYIISDTSFACTQLDVFAGCVTPVFETQLNLATSSWQDQRYQGNCIFANKILN